MITLEDVNSLLRKYYNTPFWDKTVIGGESNFTDKHFNYCKVSRTGDNANGYTYNILVENSLRTGQYYAFDANGEYITNISMNDGVITVLADTDSIEFYTELWVQSTTQNQFHKVDFIITTMSPQLYDGETTFTIGLEAVNPSYDLKTTYQIYSGGSVIAQPESTDGETITFTINPPTTNLTLKKDNIIYPLPIQKMKLLNQITLPITTLTNGQINTFTINTTSTNLKIKTEYPTTINNKTINIDLTQKNDNKKVDITIETIGDNTYYPNQFEFSLPCTYPEISSMEELESLFVNGGTGILTNNITINDNLLINKDTTLLGEGHRLLMNNHNILIPSDKSLKVKDTIFEEGQNLIIQEQNTNIELEDCVFYDCTSSTGLGSVIYCNIDLESLNNPDDYNTILKGCTFTNNDSMVYHGGNLTVTECTVNGKAEPSEYPYFLYQTDGNAYLERTLFRITNESSETDLLYNPCIFIIGENAVINNMGHEYWNKNDAGQLLNNNNKSVVDLTYHYDLISEDIHLQTNSDGYCYGASGTDYVFKYNVQISRGG